MAETEITLGSFGHLSLDEVHARLLAAATKCEGLAGLMATGGKEGDAATLRSGARRFDLGSASLGEITALLEVAERSFSENGPQLRTLLEGLIGLPPAQERRSAELSASSVLSATSTEAEPNNPFAANPITRLTKGDVTFICDWEGRGLAVCDSRLPEEIPHRCNHLGRRSPRSYFTKPQEVILDAFYLEEGGQLTLPSPVWVYGYYLCHRDYRPLSIIPESYITYYQIFDGFVNQAAGLLWKIRHLDSLKRARLKKGSSLRKFVEKIEGIQVEFEDIVGCPVTPEMLESIAMRDPSIVNRKIGEVLRPQQRSC